MKLTPGSALLPQMLFRHCDPEDFNFKSTAELTELEDIPGQSRAVEAIEFATGIGVDGHNVYVLGPAGTGRHSLVRRLLEKKAAGRSAPDDWCYVSNFSDPRKPKALALPPGRSLGLKTDVEHMIQDAQTAIPAAFEGEDFEAQREAITEEFKDAQESAFKSIEDEAGNNDIGVIQTPTGIAFIPVRDGEAVSSEDFKKLPKEEQKQFHQVIEKLTAKLQQVMRTMPKRARDMRQKIRQLERDVAGLAVAGLVEELMQKYSDIPAVVEHLQEMQTDIVENVGRFLQPADGQGMPAQIQQVMESKESAPMRRYAINVLVDRSDLKGAPVVFEDKPSFVELIGRIEHESEYGSLTTNFSLIRSGALHRANGGYLVIDAPRLFAYPLAWDGLKRAIKSGEIAIRSVADDIGLISTVSLEPEPIPLKLKVILIGERIYYYLLERYDPEFSELFKVPADFEDQMERTDENVENMARWLASIIRKEDLRHLDAKGLARLMEESARHQGDSERLSSDIERLSDLVREAHYWAGQDDNELIGAGDVQKAIDSRIRRSSRIRDRMQEELLRETFLIETSGSRVGQVNGLAVLQIGELAFGRPQRITASVKLGSGEVIDIEREVKLGGPLHSKGVLILSGFLGSHYVSDVPLSLSASLVFEQSYSGVDGDSASAAELCVLASALSEVPIKQSMAITGSIDQHGRVQAIGGVNEKIEGFFDICAHRELNGEQGVIIPVANVKHLMLRSDVVAAVEAGTFNIYPVDQVDDAITLLTGKKAGKKNSKGEFPKGSVNHKIRARLLEFADKRRDFGKPRQKEEESAGAGKSS